MGALSAGGVMQTLSSVTSIINTANSALGAIQGLGSGAEADQRSALRAQQDLALRQLQAQQGLSEANAAQDAALNRQKIASDAATTEAERRSALKRAVARQRAQYGAQGLESADGSGEAVLLGMFGESDDDRVARERLDGLRSQAIDQDLDEQRRINVLQRTQLQEKQALDRAINGY